MNAEPAAASIVSTSPSRQDTYGSTQIALYDLIIGCDRLKLICTSTVDMAREYISGTFLSRNATTRTQFNSIRAMNTVNVHSQVFVCESQELPVFVVEEDPSSTECAPDIWH